MNSIKKFRNANPDESSIYLLAIHKSPDILQQISQCIDTDNICYLYTESQHQGIQLLKEHPYTHAILLDIHFITESQQAFLELIPKVTQPLYSPKIVCTGEPENFAHAKAALQNGAIDYLGVPLKQEELLACIDRAIYLCESEKLNGQFLQKMDQSILHIEHMLTHYPTPANTEAKQDVMAHEPQLQESRYTEPAHANPFIQKALTLSRLKERNAECPDLPAFMSPGWSILMEIFTTEMSGRMAYVTTVAVGSSVAVSSTHRHLELLEQQALIKRQRDVSDKRRIRVQLTDKARDQLTHYLKRI